MTGAPGAIGNSGALFIQGDSPLNVATAVYTDPGGNSLAIDSRIAGNPTGDVVGSIFFDPANSGGAFSPANTGNSAIAELNRIAEGPPFAIENTTGGSVSPLQGPLSGQPFASPFDRTFQAQISDPTDLNGFLRTAQNNLYPNLSDTQTAGQYSVTLSPTGGYVLAQGPSTDASGATQTGSLLPPNPAISLGEASVNALPSQSNLFSTGAPSAANTSALLSGGTITTPPSSPSLPANSPAVANITPAVSGTATLMNDIRGAAVAVGNFFRNLWPF
jgi:hypothetical protein